MDATFKDVVASSGPLDGQTSVPSSRPWNLRTSSLLAISSTSTKSLVITFAVGILVVGFFVGAFVGFLVGAFVGFFVGAFVGFLVGALVGSFVGTLVGAFVGALVGTFVGAFVGAFVGFLVGAFVGFFVGDFVGFLVGTLVGSFVGALVGALVGAMVGAGVGGGAGTNGSVSISCFDLLAIVRSTLVQMPPLSRSWKGIHMHASAPGSRHCFSVRPWQKWTHCPLMGCQMHSSFWMQDQ